MRRTTISWLDRIILCFRKINRLERNFWNHEELFPHTSFLDVYALAWIGQDAVVDSSHSHFFLSDMLIQIPLYLDWKKLMRQEKMVFMLKFFQSGAKKCHQQIGRILQEVLQDRP